MNEKIRTHNLGFPRIGAKRELKRALESFWSKKMDEGQLLEAAKAIRVENWRTQKAAGIDFIPSNDFSLYDQVLDTCALVGAVPPRFQWNGETVNLSTYFAMARGATGTNACDDCSNAGATMALEMTKWFDTNYHYLVPEWHAEQTFRLSSTKPFDEFAEALAIGIRTVPVLIGPLTFLLLGKVRGQQNKSFDRLWLLPKLLPVYFEIFGRLQGQGAEWIQVDEPALCLDLSDEQRTMFADAYAQIRKAAPSLKLLLATYFGDLRDNLQTACRLPVDALHFDAVRAPHELDRILDAIPATMQLSVGVVDGRNIWRNDFVGSLELLRRAAERLHSHRLIISPSCSLVHTPLSLKHETGLDPELKSWMAFAEEKLSEVELLARLVHQERDSAALQENRRAIAGRQSSPRIHNTAVIQRSAAVQSGDFHRDFPLQHGIAWGVRGIPLPERHRAGRLGHSFAARSFRPRSTGFASSSSQGDSKRATLGESRLRSEDPEVGGSETGFGKSCRGGSHCAIHALTFSRSAMPQNSVPSMKACALLIGGQGVAWLSSLVSQEQTSIFDSNR